MTHVAILAACAATLAHAELLLQDNFNVSGAGGDINYELSSRQSGSLAPVTYAYHAVASTIHVTNAGPSAGKCRITGNAGADYTMLSPDYNFNASGNFSIEIGNAIRGALCERG